MTETTTYQPGVISHHGGAEVTNAATAKVSISSKPTPASGPLQTWDVEALDAANAAATNPRPRERREVKPQTSAVDGSANWLAGDPTNWRGHKVRSRKNGMIYKVFEVYRNSRIVLQKGGTNLATDVTAIRKNYEALA